MFLKKVLHFIGMPVEVRLKIDSAAALGIVRRLGVGRIRHLESRTLWLGQAHQHGDLNMMMVDGNDNIADIGTKSLPGKRVKHLLHLMSFTGEGLEHLEQSVVGAACMYV